MATTKEKKEYIVKQLQVLEKITCRSMMGEYLLYYDGILFGGIYENQLLIKKVKENEKFRLPEQIPYKGAKPMWKIEEIEDKEKVKEIIRTTCAYLPKKKK